MTDIVAGVRACAGPLCVIPFGHAPVFYMECQPIETNHLNLFENSLGSVLIVSAITLHEFDDNCGSLIM